MAFSSGVMRYFYPRPPRGRRRENIQCEAKLLAISIHALREEGDVSPPFWGAAGSYFYPRPPRGGRPAAESLAALTDVFLSTPSARRATTRIPPGSGAATNFYPRPPRGGRRRAAGVVPPVGLISIHALREEGDVLRRVWRVRLADFYPRPPRGGRPVRFLLLHVQQDFYPRPPRGGRPATALHRGKAAVFLSTPSARRATPTGFCLLAPCRISIHALREEGDLGELHKQLLQLNFYPRPPRGGRHAHISIPAPFAQFLSTPSARRATAAGCFDGTDKTYFYPRPPRGGRHTSVPSLSQAWIFLSTPSARRATVHTQQPLWEREISIHALREEGDFVVYC